MTNVRPAVPSPRRRCRSITISESFATDYYDVCANGRDRRVMLLDDVGLIDKLLVDDDGELIIICMGWKLERGDHLAQVYSAFCVTPGAN